MPGAPRAECIAVNPEEGPADGDKENHLSPRGADEGEGSRESSGATHSLCAFDLPADSEGKVGRERGGGPDPGK